MCGILAVLDRCRPVEEQGLRDGMTALAHRGPDQQGHWLSPCGQVGLAQTRLAIIDLEAGRQPLLTSDGQLALVANGELYDHDRLLEMLQARGHRLGSRSDSEVALHLYREMEEGMLSVLRGEFAIILWDARRQRLLAARDRFGIKPLFYAQHQGRLMLASEAKALWAAGLPRGWDPDGVLAAMHMVLPADRTLFAGIRQVPPGTLLLADSNGLTVRRYWDCDYPRKTLSFPPEREVEAIAEVGRLLDESVRLRTRADVPLACYLSGGVDSSAVLGMAARYSRVTAFTIAFEHADYDESARAAEMAAHVGADFHAVPVSSKALAEAFVPSVVAGEGLVYNGHAPARLLLSRAVSQAGFKSALGGEGADELFAGYHFAETALHGSASRPSLFKLLGRLTRPATVFDRRLAEVSASVGWVVRGLGFPSSTSSYLLSQLQAMRGVVKPEFLNHLKDPFLPVLRDVPWRKLIGREAVKVLLYLWTRSAFVNYILAAERLDMAHAVELRLPFLDHRLFELTRQLPASLLFANGQNKYLLRQVAAPYVTPAVREGAKQPFIAPPSRLLAAHLREVISSGPDVPFLHRPAVLALLGQEQPQLEPLLFVLASLVVLQEKFRL